MGQWRLKFMNFDFHEQWWFHCTGTLLYFQEVQQLKVNVLALPNNLSYLYVVCIYWFTYNIFLMHVYIKCNAISIQHTLYNAWCEFTFSARHRASHSSSEEIHRCLWPVPTQVLHAGESVQGQIQGYLQWPHWG